jgi:hypothetical protein
MFLVARWQKEQLEALEMVDDDDVLVAEGGWPPEPRCPNLAGAAEVGEGAYASSHTEFMEKADMKTAARTPTSRLHTGEAE